MPLARSCLICKRIFALINGFKKDKRKKDLDGVRRRKNEKAGETKDGAQESHLNLF